MDKKLSQVEYKVRPVTRYVVTRYEAGGYVDGEEFSGSFAGSDNCGEFENEDKAYEVGAALAFKEREDLGWPPGDERMVFPDKHGASFRTVILPVTGPWRVDRDRA